MGWGGLEEDDRVLMSARHPIPPAQGADYGGGHVLEKSHEPAHLSTPVLRYMEDECARPIEDVIREAEESAERQWIAEHGPEDAPPRPPWPVCWCAECNDWSPTNAVHSHSGHPLSWS